MSKMGTHYHKSLKHLIAKNASLQRCYSRIFAVPESSPREDLWNKALTSAFALLQQNKYPPEFLDLVKRDANVDKVLIKIAGSRHPVMQETKRLFVDGRVNFKVRGILSLLFAKAAGHSPSSPDYEEAVNQGGVSAKQRTLAEALELYYAHFLIHNSVLNLSHEKDQGISPTLQSVNGMGVLLGDFLAATGSVALASIRNNEVLRLVSQGVSDFSEAIFHGEVDKNGNMLPDQSSMRSIWQNRTFLQHASLLSNGCEGMMVLSGQQELRENARIFGKFIALALKVDKDMDEFTKLDSFCPGTPFSLDLAPVALHLESEPTLVESILNVGKDDITKLDFQQIHAATQNGNGFEKAADLLNAYISEAEKSFENMESSETIVILKEILQSLGR